MADITSTQTGNWNVGATWVGGVAPGVGDNAIIANTHVVSVNVNHGAAGVINVTIDDGGEVAFLTGATYSLWLSGILTANGTLTMVATAANTKLTLRIEGATSSFGATAIVTITGKTKDVAAQTTKVPGAANIYVDDGAGADVSNWAVSDYIALFKTTAVHGRYQLTADNGWDGTEHDYDCTAGVNYEADCRVINLTRTATLIGKDAENGTNITVADGAACAITYAEHERVKYTWNDTTGGQLFDGCSWYTTQRYACENKFAPTTATLSNQCLYSTRRNVWATLVTADFFWELSHLYCFEANSERTIFVAQSDKFGRALFEDCEIGGGATAFKTGARHLSHVVVHRMYLWGGQATSIVVDTALFYGEKILCGYDIGGNAHANTTDFSILHCPYMALDDCKVSGGTEFSIADPIMQPVVISTQHNQVSAARLELQGYGSSTKAADGDFDQNVCDEVDPSDDSEYFIYRWSFPCKSGMTPQLVFYQKQVEAGANSIDDPVVIELGDRRCGLTSVNVGATMTPNNNYTIHTVTFNGTTNRAGEVEVLIKIRDEATETGAVLRLGDFTPSGCE